MNEQEALNIDSLTITYRSRRGDVRAADDVSLSVPAGQTIALLGPNGSGKSTLLKAMCGMVISEHGVIRIMGAASPRTARHLLGVVFQSDSLDPHMTVEENLRDQAVLYGLRRDAAISRIHETLVRAGLSDRRTQLVKTLSRGLARRVDLCRALLHVPRILLLDEPTVGLDPAARAGFLAMLDERQREEQLTVVMSTHLTDEAERLARVVLMDEGRIVADDAPESLRQRVGARLVIVHSAESPPAIGGETWRQVAGGWATALPTDGGSAAHLAAQLAAAGASYSFGSPTLADVFEHFTGHVLQPNSTERPLDAASRR